MTTIDESDHEHNQREKSAQLALHELSYELNYAYARL
jgi:hypothetical protein